MTYHQPKFQLMTFVFIAGATGLFLWQVASLLYQGWRAIFGG